MSKIPYFYLDFVSATLLYLRYPVTSGDMPLILNMKLRPRLQFLDTGLLNYALGMTSVYFLVKLEQSCAK